MIRTTEAEGRAAGTPCPGTAAVGGTDLAVLVREGSEAEAWRYAVLKTIVQNARSFAGCG